MIFRADQGVPSTEFPLVIDGIVFKRRPSDLALPPETDTTMQMMADSTKRFWEPRPFFDGIANNLAYCSPQFPFSALEGDDLKNMKMIFSNGGTHRFTLFIGEPVTYTLQAGVNTVYLPRLRKCAPHLYSGLDLGGGYIVSTNLFQSVATLNGDEIDVTYAEGPTLADPGVDTIVIARQPEASGEKRGVTPIRVGGVIDEGDVLRLWTYLTLETHMRVDRVQLSGLREDHAYTFVEL